MDQRLAHLGKIVLHLFPKIYHFILYKITPATKWTCSNFRYNYDLRAKLSEDEKFIVDLMETDGYSKFSLQLCYKFFRYHHWFDPPGQTWGNAPTDTDVTLADDIERIRQLTNIIISTTSECLDEDTFLTLLQQIKDIVGRVESCFGERCNILPAINFEVMEAAEVPTLIENLYRHTMLEDHPFPSNPITQGRNRYARLGLLVVDIFPKLLREVVNRSTSASTLDRQIQRKLKENPNVLYKYITHDERVSLNSLKGNTYNELDFSLIYKLIRGFDLLDKPTQGWGKQPNSPDEKISDDIERLRKIRNLIIHKVKPNVTVDAMNNFFSELKQVAHRIDTYLLKSQSIGFETEICRFETCSLDYEMEQKYIMAVQDIEKIKAQFTVDNKIFFYYGKSFKDFIEKVREEAAKNEKKKIVIFLEDFECNTERVTILNEMKECINAKQILVKFEKATTGSLVLFIDIIDTLLSSDDQLGHELSIFVHRILQHIKCESLIKEQLNVALFKEEECIGIDLAINDIGLDTCTGFREENDNPKSLCLELNVDNSLFESEDDMKSEIGGIVERILKSYGSKEVPSASAILSYHDRFRDKFSERCNVCNSEQSVYWCYECKIQLCSKCGIRHQRTKNTSYHHVQHEHDKYKPDYNFVINGLGVRDIKVTTDGLLVIGDRKGKQLIVCGMAGQKKLSIDLPGMPECIAVVDSNTVAVTIPISSQILLVDIRSGLIVKHIYVNVYSPVICINKHLYIGCCDHTIKVLSLSGEVTRSIQLSFKPKYLCSGTEGNIYSTDREKVYCIDTDGNVLFTSSPSEVIDPCSIAIDDIGDILFVCHKSNVIHKISPDGNKSQVIVKQIPSGWVPYICYHSPSKSLVLGRDDKIHIYNHCR